MVILSIKDKFTNCFLSFEGHLLIDHKELTIIETCVLVMEDIA